MNLPGTPVFRVATWVGHSGPLLNPKRSQVTPQHCQHLIHYPFQWVELRAMVGLVPVSDVYLGWVQVRRFLGNHRMSAELLQCHLVNEGIRHAVFNEA